MAFSGLAAFVSDAAQVSHERDDIHDREQEPAGCRQTKPGISKPVVVVGIRGCEQANGRAEARDRY